MILQVQDILMDALGLTGCIAMDETPTASELAVALRTANVMIDRWASQRLLMRSTTPLSFPTVAGQASYTVGTVGANIIASRPTKIYSGYYRDSSNNDTAVEIIDITTYNNLQDKIISEGVPTYIAYDPGTTQQSVPVSTIYVYSCPDQVYTIYLECDSYLTEFVNLSDTVTFEPAYYEALIYNLAIRLFRMYRDATIPVPQEIVQIAGNCLNNLKAMNSVALQAGMDLPGKVSNYNIYTDGN